VKDKNFNPWKHSQEKCSFVGVGHKMENMLIGIEKSFVGIDIFR
jgi:hypothetical protein